jgi:hypothetical protein
MPDAISPCIGPDVPEVALSQFSLGSTVRTPHEKSAVAKETVMRRILTTIAIFAVTSLVAVSGASAQNYRLQANIPFDFTVDNELLPAGTYIFTSNQPSNLLLENRHRSISAFVNGFADDKASGEQPKVIFDRIGDQYFLHEIVATTASASVSIPIPKLERQYKSQYAALQRGETTVIAMKQ